MLLGEFIGIIEISMIWAHKFLERMHLHGGCSTTWKNPEQISGLLHQRMGIPKFPTHEDELEPIRTHGLTALLNVGRDSPSVIC